MHLMIFIGSLDVGGTETQTVYLAQGLAVKDPVTIVCIYGGGQNYQTLETSQNIKIIALFPHKPASKWQIIWHMLLAPRKLRAIIHREHTTVLYSFLYASNFIAWVATRRTNVKLVWGIRTSQTKFNWKRQIPFYLCRLVSSQIPLLIANSHSSLQAHLQNGYRAQKNLVIYNGFSPKYRPDPQKRIQQRSTWQIPEGRKVIGIVARLSPVKDHIGFLQTASIVAKNIPGTMFVCVGDGPQNYRNHLQITAKNLGIASQTLWFSREADMVAVYNALDVLVLCSLNEGFPNVISEAMLCGIPCVASDVGDCAKIITDFGHIVPPQNPVLLAKATEIVLNHPNRWSSDAIRKQILDNFSMQNLIRETQEALSWYP